ncbi:nucleotidyltransferase-like protein [Fontibacillus phaseoli]|uniref:Nucleotidyltransferase-like protein n=1 Tax=Fontibacillus phaseoli TaxID=1416533 RepID=A0A369AXL2_9BACL|nr:nucleotidyltransferase-like protein [Fontibacillus phaseoli]RCX13891.1 nucleotidyltransferase-like protein [Fontibacillus phaseoli]
MEPTFFSFTNKEKNGHRAIGAVGYRHAGNSFHGSLLHDFELLVLVVFEDEDIDGLQIEHCMSGNIQYQMRYIGKNELQRWVIEGENREIVKCFMKGEVIWDVGGEVTKLRNELTGFGNSMRERLKLKEFAKFLRTYVEAKQYTRERDFTDAYYSVLQTLKHYARIELIDQGIAPEHSVWEQLRSINTVVHKLFDELTESKETLEQRVELVLLACEFFVMSRMEDCCSALLRVLGSRREAWSIQELIALPEMAHVKEELPMIIRKLVYRSLVKQSTAVPGERRGDSREIRYWA